MTQEVECPPDEEVCGFATGAAIRSQHCTTDMQFRPARKLSYQHFGYFRWSWVGRDVDTVSRYPPTGAALSSAVFDQSAAFLDEASDERSPTRSASDQTAPHAATDEMCHPYLKRFDREVPPQSKARNATPMAGANHRVANWSKPVVQPCRLAVLPRLFFPMIDCDDHAKWLQMQVKLLI